MESSTEANEVRNLVGGLARLDVAPSRRDAIRNAGLAALAQSQPSWWTALAAMWQRTEPALAFGVGAVYLSLAFHAVISIY